MRSPSAIALASILALAAAPARAERPDTEHLVLAGLAMAPASYAIGVTVHEGSHALAAVMLGLDVTSMRLTPGFHPRTQRFYFGWVDVRGVTSSTQRALFLAAPKAADALLLGAYAALVLTGTVPDNRYGLLAMTVVATGTWVDFSRDVVAWWPHNDTVRVYDALGARREWQRLPWRALHAGLAALAAVPLVVGYRGVFERDDDASDATLLPIWTGAF